MTWWLSASAAELKAARTCSQCGCSDADIDLNMCFECFSAQSEGDRARQNAAIASKYGLLNRQHELLAQAAEADGKNQCNRHNDCEAANVKARAAGYACAEHCRDECCEDCFGC